MTIKSVCAWAREMIAQGYSPEAALIAWRGKTIVFEPLPLSHWAALTTREDGARSIRFVRYRPPLCRRVAGQAPQAGELHSPGQSMPEHERALCEAGPAHEGGAK